MLDLAERITCWPLMIGPNLDKLVPEKYFPTALLLLDPLKLEPDEITRSLQKVSPEFMREMWRLNFSDYQSLEPLVQRKRGNIVDQAIRDEAIKTEVYARLNRGEWREALEYALTPSLERLRNDGPEGVFNEAILPTIERSIATVLGIPEIVRGDLSELTRVDFHTRPDKFRKDVQRAKTQILAGLTKVSPEIVGAAFETYGAQIMVFSGLIRELQAAGMAGIEKCILIDESYVLNKELRTKLIFALREELVHLLDRAFGKYTDTPDFVASAKSFMEDNGELAKIDSARAATNGYGGLEGLADYKRKGLRLLPEFLATWCNMREEYIENHSRAGCGGWILGINGASREVAEQRADAQLKKIFGDDLHDLCKEFLEQVREKAPEEYRRQGREGR